VGLGRPVEFSPGETGPGPHGAGGGIDPDLLHHREVDDHSIVTKGLARDVVAAPAHGNGQVVTLGELEGALDVRRRPAARDQGGMLVDHRVEQGAGRVVVRVAGPEYLAAQGSLELPEGLGFELGDFGADCH
jgi:hypothetical protein